MHHANERWLEHALSRGDALALTDFDDVAAGQLVGSLFLGQVVVAPFLLFVEVARHVAHLLLDVANVVIVAFINRQLGLHELLHEFVCDILSGYFDGLHGVRQSIALEHGHCVGYTLA